MKLITSNISCEKNSPQIAQPNEIWIEACNIAKYYNAAPVLKNITLQLSRGEKVAFIGPSGAGKTTLLKILSGSLSPSEGNLLIDRCPLYPPEKPPLQMMKSQVAFIHQDFGLTPNLSVLQNIVCGRLGKTGFWRGLRSVLFPTKSETEEVYRLLKRLGIADTLFNPAAQLSGGEYQRVAIGRALYQHPKVLFADEPVSNLDPARAQALLKQLTMMCQTRDLTLCISLHNLDFAKRFFDRLIGLRYGEIVFDTAPVRLSAKDISDLYAITPLTLGKTGSNRNVFTQQNR